MKTLFLDVSTGVAGDMLSAALLELFDNREEIVACLNAIGLRGVVFRSDKVKSDDIVGTQMTVTWQGAEEAPGCQHLHDAHEHHHDHRHLFDIQQIVATLNLPYRVKTHVREVYYLIAAAAIRATSHAASGSRRASRPDNIEKSTIDKKRHRSVRKRSDAAFCLYSIQTASPMLARTALRRPKSFFPMPEARFSTPMGGCWA